MYQPKMTEKQLWDKHRAIYKAPSFSFGQCCSYQFRNTPRHILFSLSHYKFASKMIGADKNILELGCNEGLGSYYLSEFARHVHGVDFDEEAIAWAKDNLESEKLSFQCDDVLDKKYGDYDAVVAFDVIEHIYKRNEDKFMRALVKNLVHDGVCLVGTPNETSQQYSKPEISGAHVNIYSGERLVESLQRYFHNVFLFSANDEIIHTGYTPMAQYLIALSCYRKESAIEL